MRQQQKPGIYGFETLVMSLEIKTETNEEGEEVTTEVTITQMLLSDRDHSIVTKYEKDQEDVAAEDVSNLLVWLGAQGWEKKSFQPEGDNLYVVLERMLLPDECVKVLNSLDTASLERLHLI